MPAPLLCLLRPQAAVGSVSTAVSGRRRISAATWSSVWYLLSSFAVITYTRDWTYVIFAALGSWIGAYLSMTLLHPPPRNAPAPVAPPLD